MKKPFRFRHIEPIFFAGLLDDPILLVRIRPSGRLLMFDCGQVHHLAKRNFTHLDAIFISHGHMDHWMGIDSVIRHLIAANRTLDLFGPTGLADKMAHKLAGYDWNLVEDYWCSFRVHEVSPAQITTYLFSGPSGFKRSLLETRPHDSSPIYETAHCLVYADSCSHGIESLIYRLDERPAFRIDAARLTELGLRPGSWLGEIKEYFFTRRPGNVRLTVPLDNGGEKQIHEIDQLDELLKQIVSPQTISSLGYISDIGFRAENIRTIAGFMAGVELLFCECTYLGEDKEKARVADHLCSEDVNQLLRMLRPAWFVPMHLSKTYRRRTDLLFRQLAPPPPTRVVAMPPFMTPRPLRAEEVVWSEISE